MIGAVANGMDGHAQANLRGFAAVFEKFLAIHVENAAVVLFACIRLEHGGGVRTERAIHEDFDGADAEHSSPKPAAQTEFVGLIEQFQRECSSARAI